MKTILFTLFVTLFSTFAFANDAFKDVKTSKSYKDLKHHNPANTIKYSADPGVMVYNDRVYVYGTNDGYVEELSKDIETNGYGQINTLNLISSDDLVNWVDHGTIPVAGPEGIAKWASYSWAPAATHKKIDGKDKFFLYFANNANGVGVLTSDSPIGPFVDPLGKPLVSRDDPNCSDIVWLFDPAVFVDDDGTGYLYFGGGLPDNQDDHPKTLRAVQLADDMIHIVGTPVTIDAPWAFEDSGINKIGDTYFYSYCTNFKDGELGNGRIAYMTSKSPLGPFTYQDTIFNNPEDFFGDGGNNHHTIINLKGKFYIFYHAQWLNVQVFGEAKGYRTTHVDVIPFADGKFGNATGTLEGVEQLLKVNPYETQTAALFAWTGGISINGLGQTTASYNKGDWTGISGVEFSKGASTVVLTASSEAGAVIRITTGNENGEVVGYVTVPPTGAENFKSVTAEVENVTGTQDLFFTASGDVTLDTWKFIASDENDSESDDDDEEVDGQVEEDNEDSESGNEN